jgi:sterol desaturase/sphingolipid hydroxylase (fatty acid hydroxylase superfamily)
MESKLMTSFLIPLGILTLMFGLVSTLERIPRLQHTPSRFHRPWFETDLLWYLVAALAAGLSTFILRPILVKLTIPGLSTVVGSLPWAVALIVAVVVFDGVFFAVHIGLHRSDTLWNFHKVHHSSRRLDFLATTRTHAFEHLLRNVPAQLVLFASGFAPETIATSILVLGGFGVLNHSNLRLPLSSVEWLFVTPRLHRVHHVPVTSGNNYATIFSFWDRAKGSLRQLDTPAETILGVPAEVDTYPQSFVPAFREPARQIIVERQAAKAFAESDARA